MQEKLVRAIRMKLTFDSPNGPLTIQDLYDLPLFSNGRANCANLEDMTAAAHAEVEKTPSTSFFRKSSAVNDVPKLKFDILMFVGETIKAEQEAAENAAINKARKQELLAVLAELEKNELKSKSPEEIRAMIDQL